MSALLLRLLPVLLALGIALARWHFSARRMGQALDRRSRPLSDSGLAPLLDRMAAALGLAALPVRVLDTEEINGFATPDGRVFLTSGLLGLYRRGEATAEEIASVVAHELGHVARGHARRRMLDVSGAEALSGALARILLHRVPGIGPALAPGLARGAGRLFTARRSRSTEFDADAFATALLLKAGIGAGPQLSLLAKLDRRVGIGAAVPDWFASHPATEERMRKIRENDARWRG